MTEPDTDWFAGSIADAERVRALLIAEAAARRAISYSGLLNLLGHRFTRPKMRALCRTLDVLDEVARARAEPDVAVLVVRESDGLPGQGWWVGNAHRLGYAGAWSGPEARAFVASRQTLAFDRWTGSGTAAAGGT